MVAKKDIKKKNKSPETGKLNKITKKTDETQKKLQVRKIKKANNATLVEAPKAAPVKEAIDKEQLPAAAQAKSKPSSADLKAKKDARLQATVVVGQLKYSATDEKLREIFSKCGQIKYVRTLQSPDNKGCNGVAFVCFKNANSVPLAIEQKGVKLDGRPIKVERYSINQSPKLAKLPEPIDEFRAKMQEIGKKYVPKDKFKEKMKRIGRKYVNVRVGEEKEAIKDDESKKNKQNFVENSICKEKDEEKQEGETPETPQDEFKAKMQQIGRMELSKMPGQFVKNPRFNKKSEFRGIKSKVIKKTKPTPPS